MTLEKSAKSIDINADVRANLFRHTLSKPLISVAYSLRRGPGANVQDSSGYSALHHAALNGHKEIVKLLLDHDASTNIVDVKGSSPLHLAAWSGNVEIVKLLLSGPSICNVNLTVKLQDY